MPILSKEHLWGQALMLDEQVWLAIDITGHPKSVQWVRAAGTEKGLPQPVAIKLEAYN